MLYALDHLNEIREFLEQTPFGLITDLDGTISQIAPTHKEASVSPLCRRYLSILREYLALIAVVSGRSAEIVKNLVGIDGIVYIGNHGMERLTQGRSEYPAEVNEHIALIQTALEELQPLVSVEGVYIEDKGVSATVHYRLSREPQSVRKHILSLLEKSPRLKPLRIVPGRMIIDLLPPVEINKGTAILELIRDYHLKGGFYLGDDATDIDAFTAIHTASGDPDFKGLAFGITSPEMPDELPAQVDFTLNGVSDVEYFLKWLSRTARQSAG